MTCSGAASILRRSWRRELQERAHLNRRGETASYIEPDRRESLTYTYWDGRTRSVAHRCGVWEFDGDRHADDAGRACSGAAPVVARAAQGMRWLVIRDDQDARASMQSPAHADAVGQLASLSAGAAPTAGHLHTPHALVAVRSR